MDEHYGNQSMMSKWSRQMIKKLKQIREMAWSYTWIHRENAAYLTDMYEWISVISYSISFFNGIILIFPSNIVYIRILNILLSFGAGILVFYIKNKEFPQTAERHKIASSKFSNIYNNISRQLSLDVVYREEAINYHRWITLQYENLYGTAPDIDPPIIEDYIRKFAGRRKFNPIEAAEFDQTNSTSNSDHPQTESTISTNDNHHDDNDDDNNDDQNNHIDHDHQDDDDYEEEESRSDLDGTESNGDHVLEQYSANTEPYDEGKTNTFADTSISIVSFDDGRREGHVLSDADRQALDALKLSMANDTFNGIASSITPSQMEEGLATNSASISVDKEDIIQSTNKITIPSIPLDTIIEEMTNNRKKREQNVNNNTNNPNTNNTHTNNPNTNTNNTHTNNPNINNVANNAINNKNNKVIDDIYDPRRPSISLSSDSRRSSDMFNSRRSSVATQLDSRRPSIAPLYNRQSTADIQREYNNGSGGTGYSNNGGGGTGHSTNNNGTGGYSINGYLDNNNYYGRPRRKNSHIAYEMRRMRHNSHEYMYSNGMDAGFMSTKCAIPEFELMQQEQIAYTSRTTKGGSGNNSSSNIPRPRSNKS